MGRSNSVKEPRFYGIYLHLRRFLYFSSYVTTRTGLSESQDTLRWSHRIEEYKKGTESETDNYEWRWGSKSDVQFLVKRGSGVLNQLTGENMRTWVGHVQKSGGVTNNQRIIDIRKSLKSGPLWTRQCRK